MDVSILDLGTVCRDGHHPIYGYLLRDGTMSVLVDTGPPRDGRGRRYLMASPHQSLARQLELCGVSPEQIDVVVITHFDQDHFGNLDMFPYSDFLVQRSQVECAKARHGASAELDRHYWDLPCIDFFELDGDHQLTPEIHILATAGDRGGHQSVLADLSPGHLLIASGVCPTSSPHNHPGRGNSRLQRFAFENDAWVLSGHSLKQRQEIQMAPHSYQFATSQGPAEVREDRQVDEGAFFG